MSELTSSDINIEPAIIDVLEERARQDLKWGEQNHDPFTYLTILIEEVGEMAQAALHTRFGGKHGGLEHLREEAVQTAAVALAIVECLDRKKWQWAEPPKTEDQTCYWTPDQGYDYIAYDSSCGKSWVFEEGGPAENDMNYCPFCGKNLVPEMPSQEGQQ